MRKENIFSESDFAFFIDLVKKAGEEALILQKKGLEVQRKEDSTIVTDADFIIQAFLISEISSRYPDFLFIHEENFNKSDKLITDDTITVIIDPIDGTAMFSMHLPIWCISIGIFKGFEPLYGFVYSPGSDMLFHTDNDNSYLNNNKLIVDKNIPIDSETNIFCSSEINFSRIKFPGKIRNLGSTALHACLTADNKRNRLLAFTGKSYLWDWAGAIPVIKKAGGNIKYLNGRDIDIKGIIQNGYALEDYAVIYNSDNFELIKGIFNNMT
jgi:fructose-1,6-bisphosphatase/inositol monophosphatase family enzyme